MSRLDIDQRCVDCMSFCEECEGVSRDEDADLSSCYRADDRCGSSGFKLRSAEEQLKLSGKMSETQAANYEAEDEQSERMLCGIPANDYLDEGILQISVLRDEMLQKLEEIEFIIQDISENTQNELLLKRAQLYWIAHVRGALDVSKKTSFVSLDDTIKEIAEEKS